MDWNSRRVRTILEAALAEDKAAADLTTTLTIDRKLRATGTIVAKQGCVIAGLGCIPVILELFAAHATRAGHPAARFQVISHPEIFDGVKVRKGQPIAVIRSNAAALLSTERVILNVLQRMSGIATLTADFAKAVAGTKTKVVDTRKTTPGLRILDKYAVCCGGGLNHRLDLQDGILIKANHIALGGGITLALEHALKFRRGKQPIQIEVHTLAELAEAIAAGAESFLLDGMTAAIVAKAVKQIRAVLPSAPIEAAGGIALADVRAYAQAGVDFVAIGLLTHSPGAADLGMRIVPDVS
jgi:nicotinate-nucleotide pyrophosphorylase (carboxylating)